MNNAETMITNLDERARYLESLATTGIPVAPVQQQQVDAIVLGFNTSTLSLEEATRVAGHLKHGPWSAAQVTTMASALASAQSRAPTQHVGQVNRKPQTLLNAENWFMQEDWDQAMDNKISKAGRTAIFGRRLYGMGVVSPDADLMRRVGSIVASLEDDPMSTTGPGRRDMCLAIQSQVTAFVKVQRIFKTMALYIKLLIQNIIMCTRGILLNSICVQIARYMIR